MTVRIMHVDLDAFFVEVCRQVNPELRDVDLLVVGGRRDQRGVVQSASYGARRYGVRSGMPIGRAVALCPQATFHQGEFLHYRQASRTVRQVMKEFSPTVVSASLDEAYLDFSGTDRLYPVSLLPVAEAIRDRIREATGLASSVGIGPNRMVAKIASEEAKPRGLLEVRAGWEEGFLAGLRLSAIPGIGPKTSRRLAEVGLTLVSQVQAMTAEELERVVGRYGAWLKRRAHGHGGTVLRGGGRGFPKSVSRETTLAHDSQDPQLLERLIGLFSARVASQLRAEGLMARTVGLKLRHGDFKTVTRQRTLTEPTDLDQEIVAAAKELFHELLPDVRKRGKRVRLIGVSANNLIPITQRDLFEPPTRTRLRQLATAVDRVRERYGFDAVQQASIVKRRERRPDPSE